MDTDIQAMINHFHHIDADVLEKISPDEMAVILSSSDFKCDEEIIARQVRVWALFGNHAKAHRLYNLIRWNCILPAAREQIQHRLPRLWRAVPVEHERLKPRTDLGYHYIAGGFYDPFYRSRNRNILRISVNFDVKEVTPMPDFVPGFASPTGMVIIDGNICIVFRTSYDINAKSNMARYKINSNSWEDLGPVPAYGSFGFVSWQGGVVVVGGKKETAPSGRHNRIRTAPSEEVWFYSLELSEWRQLGSLSQPRINPTVAVINDALYCCSGLSPSPTDSDMVINNPDTERLLQLSERWETSEFMFHQSAHQIRYYNGFIFMSYQNRNAEKLDIGLIDLENNSITWKRSLDLPAGAQHCFNDKKLFVFGGILSEVANNQIIPFEVLQMSERISSINLDEIEDENVQLQLEDVGITPNNKISLFCANIVKGPIY